MKRCCVCGSKIMEGNQCAECKKLIKKSLSEAMKKVKPGSPLVSGCQLQFDAMTSSVEPQVYEVMKMQVWLDLLRKGEMPARWNKAGKKGTLVTVASIYSKEIHNRSLEYLKKYITEYNEKYGAKIELVTETLN